MIFEAILIVAVETPDPHMRWKATLPETNSLPLKNDGFQ